MTRFKFLLFVAVLFGFAALAHAGFDDGKAAYDRGYFSTAYKELQALAGLGDAEAQYYLGRMYDRGQGVPEDHAEAMRWYRKAANQGLPQAEFNLGLMYAKGQAVAKDNAEALKWLRKSGEQGYAEAQSLLGVMYYLGQGVAKNDVEGIKWLNKSAEQRAAQLDPARSGETVPPLAERRDSD
ncbi:MAG: tetratricopeptide repeat protein [Syntrophobacteraceae bacterium]